MGVEGGGGGGGWGGWGGGVGGVGGGGGGGGVGWGGGVCGSVWLCVAVWWLCGDCVCGAGVVWGWLWGVSVVPAWCVCVVAWSDAVVDLGLGGDVGFLWSGVGTVVVGVETSGSVLVSCTDAVTASSRRRVCT